MKNNTQPNLILIISRETPEAARAGRHMLCRLAENVFADVMTAITDMDDGETLAYALSAICELVGELMEQGHTEEAFHLVTGLAHIAYADAKIKVIGRSIDSYDEGREQFLACFVRVMGNFFNEEED